MPHNFSPGAQLYYSKTGANGAAGSPDSPLLLNINSLFNFGVTHIVGAGSYKWPLGAQGQSNATVYADGHVRIVGDGTHGQYCVGGGSYYGIVFTQFLGMSLYMPSNQFVSFTGCTFDFLGGGGLNMATYNGAHIFVDCIFINLTGDGNAYGTLNKYFYNCLFINSQFDTSGAPYTQIIGCYFDRNSGFRTGSSAAIDNNNIDPETQIGPYRGIQVGGGAWSNGATVGTGNIQLAPEFNNPALGDYTLRATSPHIVRSIGPGHLRVAVSQTIAYTGAGADVSTANTGMLSSLGGVVALNSVSGDALQVNTLNGLVIKPNNAGSGVSTFVSGVLTLDPNVAKEMGMVIPLVGLNMDSDFQTNDFFAPEIRNNNVPDFNNGTVGSALRNPNRLTYRMRWSTLASPSITNPAHWVGGAVWSEMQWFTKASYNLAGYAGNADLAYNPGAALPILCRTYQIEITTRNNYGA